MSVLRTGGVLDTRLMVGVPANLLGGVKMSCSKWAYKPEMCDGQICPGDCDLCHLWEEYGEDDDEEETQEVLGLQKGFE